MKILHVVTAHTPDYAFGGPVRVATNLAREQASRGHSVHIAAMALGFVGDLPSEIDGVPATLFRGRKVLPIGGFSSYRPNGLSKWLRRRLWDVDLLHVHAARDFVTLPSARLAERMGVPVVMQTHGMIDETERLLGRLLDKTMTARTLNSANAVLYLTPTERESLQVVSLSELTGRLHFLPNGTATGGQRDPDAISGPVLYAARLQARKRPAVFVEAAQLLASKNPDLCFEMAGADEGELAGVLDAVESKGPVNFSYLGALSADALNSRYAAASVYVLPSVNEPFPMSVLEAMSFGAPVVITHTNGLAQAVADAGAGLVVDSSPEQVATAVEELLEPVVNEKASQAARQLVDTQFRLPAVVDRLEEIYVDALAHSSKRVANSE